MIPHACRLPEGWSDLEFVDDRIVIRGVDIHRSGVMARSPDGQEVTGSAAGSSSDVRERSFYELLERVCTLEAISCEVPFVGRSNARCAGEDLSHVEVFPISDDPARWRYARSNGVAIHSSWDSACERAFRELVERHRVLQSWYGLTLPRRVDLPCDACAFPAGYDVIACTFPALGDEAWSSGVSVAGVFAFPKEPELPFALGYAGRRSIEEATRAASDEALQVLAFLWGEVCPPATEDVAPVALAHLDHFQDPRRHETLRRWIEGDHVAHARSDTYSRRDEPALFVDLTPAWIGRDLRIVKAWSRSAQPLAFGASPFTAHMPPELRIHPIA